MSSPTAEVLGEIGLPVSIRELAAKTWDVIIVGAGHNGLACAATLARAGQRVLVIESRARVGGACTIEEPFPGVRMSPCAYLAGLLHPLVVEELELAQRGFVWTPAVNGLFVPFLDGSSIQLWDDDERCAAEVRALAPGDVEGWRAMSDVIRRLRDALRPAGAARPLDRRAAHARTDRRSPRRRCRSARRALRLVDGRVCRALHRRRAPADRLSRPGRDRHQRQPLRSRHRFHPLSSCLGRLGGMPGMWGYVRGGMGMVSFYFCDAAREAGATVVSGVPWRRFFPAKASRLKAASASPRAPSSPMPTRGRHSAPARRRGRPRLARASRARSHRRLHRQAQRPSARAAQLHRPPRHRTAPPLRPDQRAAHQRRVEGRLRRRAPRRVARASLVRALFPKRARSLRSSPQASTP